MEKYYIAPTRTGRMLKIVEDVKVPTGGKLKALGVQKEAYIIRQRLVARFVNEGEAQAFLNSYNFFEEACGDDA